MNIGSPSRGRKDAAISDPHVMQYHATKIGDIKIEVAQTVMKKELVVAFRKGEDNKHQGKGNINKLTNYF